MKDTDIDYAGFFAYSREEGTAADKLDGHIADEVKQARADELSTLWQEKLAKRNQTLIGTRVRAIYDGIDYDRQAFIARSAAQAPDIDNVIYFTADSVMQVGNFYDIEIIDTDGVDLVGRVVE